MDGKFEIQLDRLEAGRTRFVLGSAEGGELTLAEDPEATETCHVQGELVVDDMDQKVLVHGGFEVDRHLDCHRCAKPSRQRYTAHVEVMILRSRLRGLEDDIEKDAWVVQQQRGPVSLVTPLREAVFLHEPQRVLCREDCAGLCPQCGVDRNAENCDCSQEESDPRWGALKELRDRVEPSSDDA